jgi:hypothetical protein
LYQIYKAVTAARKKRKAKVQKEPDIRTMGGNPGGPEEEEGKED